MSKPLRPPASAVAAAASAYRPPQAPINTLRFDCTEGRLPSAVVLRAIRKSKSDAWRRYPDAGELESLIAKRFGIRPENVLVTAGADEALDRVCRAYLEPGRQALVTHPTFEIIPRWIKLAGAQVVEVPWLRGRLPLSRLLRLAGRRTSVAFVVSPNNPTGLAARGADLRQLALALSGTLVVLDAVYVEFADEDPTRELLALENFLVIRSLSKAWSLAGLRVGYALGPAEVIERLRAVGGPYSVSRLSLALAGEQLGRAGAAVARYVARVRQERTELTKLLRRLGAEPFESQANFVLCRFRRAGFVQRALATLGIQVRSFPGRRELKGCLRLTCPGRRREFSRLCRTIERVLRPQAVLFDMDGVLADVSASYHRAVIETARTFGVRLSPVAVRRAKLEPDSNNDWRVTQRLIAREGKRVALSEVTRRFENLYHGCGGNPGLWRREKAIFSAGLLRRLGRGFKLGVVTGRPGRDARRFLEKENLGHFFSALVCLEDALPKPQPEPVRLALRRLGVERAWLLGDAPDDLAAARAASVVPLGFCDGQPRKRHALQKAGAAEVLARPAELPRLLGIPSKGDKP